VRPGGHLASAIALGGLAWAASSSLELAAGCFSGAFLIDVDHYFDYMTVEGQWRRPSPTAFLRYYFTNRLRRVVLPLHSIELLGALVVVAAVWPRPALLGYVAGAVLHLVFDIRFNGEAILFSPDRFYFFVHRARYGFAADRLLAQVVLPPGTGQRPVREFFTWRPPERRSGASGPPSTATAPSVGRERRLA
jgi:hypothetical protein